MEEVNSFKIFEKLKSVYRYATVDNRHESVAEHTWAAIVLADQLLEATDPTLNRLKVFELQLYHDAVEIVTNDLPLHPDFDRSDKDGIEIKGSLELASKLAPKVSAKYLALFNEYLEGKTREAKFARCIDLLEADIHDLDYRIDWKDWTKEFHLASKLSYFEDFPYLKRIFLELVEYLDREGYYKK